MTRPTKAIIIAAGRGRRLVPYTDEAPKCLVPVTDKPIARIAIDALRAHGIDDIVMIRGYKGDVLEARADELGAPVRFVDNPEWEHNNILESLFYAEHELDGPVVLLYSDIIFTEDVARRLMAADAEVGLVVDVRFRDIYEGRTDHPLSEAEVCDLDDAGHIARVGKRSVPVAQAWGEFIGLAKLSAAATATFRQRWRALLETYRGRESEPFVRAPTFRQAYLTDLFQHLIGSGTAMTPVPIEGQWREIDTVQDLQRARALLSSNQETWS